MTAVAVALPPSTLEVNETRAYLHSSREGACAWAWYRVGVERRAEAGIPIAITVVIVGGMGDLVHVTYPQTGEQLAKAAYERLLSRGIAHSALRYRGEVT